MIQNTPVLQIFLSIHIYPHVWIFEFSASHHLIISYHRQTSSAVSEPEVWAQSGRRPGLGVPQQQIGDDVWSAQSFFFLVRERDGSGLGGAGEQTIKIG